MAYNYGLEFEKQLKQKLRKNGIIALNLGYNEIGDLIIPLKHIIIECKTTHSPIWYRKNPKQYDRLKELKNSGIYVFIAIKFRINNKSYLKFFEIDFKYYKTM